MFNGIDARPRLTADAGGGLPGAVDQAPCARSADGSAGRSGCCPGPPATGGGEAGRDGTLARPGGRGEAHGDWWACAAGRTGGVSAAGGEGTLARPAGGLPFPRSLGDPDTPS
jgi:hypothetical protein